MGLEGTPGRFTARVVTAPRFIDLSKCTSCGECAKVCPVELPDAYNEGLTTRKAAFKQYAQAMPGAFAIQKADKAPCRRACPAGLNVQGYVQMVKEGKYREALEIIMEDLPLPGVLGRICPHGCEDACRRKEVDQPIAIRDLKRLAADMVDPRDIEVSCAAARSEKVAVIGSGPAGLSAAYHLARKGIRSTIYEALPDAGGMLRVGIPDHRLPREVLDREIEVITNLGVEIKTDTPLDADLTVESLLSGGYKAVYLALGAHKGIEMGIPGEKTRGVRQGVDFLREVNLTGTADAGKHVAVVGGGNVAIDVSRAAVRLGAESVTILYRRSREEMPAWEEEVAAAEAEGVKIEFLTAPQEVLTRDGAAVGIRCVSMKLTEPDSSGRRRPVPVPGTEHDIEADLIIPAIGQRPDLSAIEDITGLQFTRWGTAETDPVSYAMGLEGVFAGGDLQTGPWVAIGAIAAGREAAESIVRFLDGKDMAEGRGAEETEDPDYRPIPEKIPLKDRARMPELSVDARAGNFNEVELGYDEAAGREEADRCLNCGYCSECYQCVDACLAEAVDHGQRRKEMTIDVGAVILCPGSEPFDPTPFEENYHYRSHPNVLTSLEFERYLSASGPTMGHMVRPSDHKEPAKIAWLQCVGSRDTNRCGNGYCSSVCCMYAMKDAMVAKEHAAGDLDCLIFNMDIRSFGKEYERYYQRAKNEGIRFVKARVHTVDPIRGSGDLRIRFVDEDGSLKEEIVSLVVLSVGLQVPKDTAEMARRLEIDLDRYNFAVTHPFAPVETSRPGVYACGIFNEPKDIPSSVMEASAAASAAAGRLAAGRNTCTTAPAVPEEIDVSGQPPRVGVFVCNCGINIGGVVDVPGVVKYAQSLPDVVFCGENLFTCSQDAQDRMKEIIKEHRINRVVVAACSPKTHEGIFMETLEACGINRYLFEMANIRNQDSWVHGGDAVSATEKARDLVRMAVARAVTLKPLVQSKIPVNHRALVIGGGVAGMNAALSLGDQGFEVVLVEKEKDLGGLAGRLTETIEGAEIAPYLAGLIRKVMDHPKVQVLTQSLVVDFSGFKGNFTTEVLVGPGMYERKISHGAMVIATGGHEYRPKEYGYGESERVMTQIELSHHLNENGAEGLSQVVMIQCVGSRNDENPNCSRICCQTAVKNALHIKKLNPDADVYVLYRDIRTYGLLEEYYTQAREKGVMFFRFDPENPPRVETAGGKVAVTFQDSVIGRTLRVSPDLLALSAGLEAEDTEELSAILKLARNSEGFFSEAHVKLRPVDMATDGIFVCGSAHGPKLISESISQALGAAARAATFLAQDHLTLSAVTAWVEGEKCASCLICVRSCPYGVPKIGEEGVSEIDAALCHGCGICASECPAKAIELNWYEDDQILSKVNALLEGVL